MDNGSSSIDQKLISKVQYKTYEKGEYDAEQRRSLPEVLELIDEFPWDEQRPLADVQLSCPSVTILNDKNEYLKIGVYFNNKFTAYFLNDGHHLYERHLPTMADVHETVTAFFNDDLPMDQFERDYLTFGAIHHLETKSFEYRVTYWQLMAIAGMIIYIAFALVPMLLFFEGRSSAIVSLFPLVMILLFSGLSIKAIRDFYNSRNMYLQLSKGHDEFLFGMNDENINTYNKKDIELINIYDRNSKGTRGSYEICFNDGTSIYFTSILIPLIDFMSKFPKNKYLYKRHSFWSKSMPK